MMSNLRLPVRFSVTLPQTGREAEYGNRVALPVADPRQVCLLGSIVAPASFHLRLARWC